MNAFTRLAQANMDHFNNHPTRHTLLTVAAGVGAVVAIRTMARKMAENDAYTRSQTGRYAK